jgi:hypothetical protein
VYYPSPVSDAEHGGPRKKKVAAAILGTLSLLFLHNVVLTVRNQLIFDRNHRYGVEHGRLAEIAAAHTHQNVVQRIAIYYLIRDHVENASVVMPQALARVSWWMARAARVEVEMTDDPLLLDEAASSKLVALASSSAVLHARDVTPIHFIFRDGERRYVIAQTEDKGPLLFLPEPMYRAAASRTAGSP